MKTIDDIEVIGTFVEQLRVMQSDRLGGLRRFVAEERDIGRFAFLFGDVLLVNTPALVHEVLVTRARTFAKSPVLRGALHPLVGEGLFTSEGELWRRQRKLMAPLFHQGNVAGFAADMTAAAERAAATWRDREVVDVARETTRITMAVAGSTLFGTDTFSESDELGAALGEALAWAGEQSSSITLIAQARASIGLELLADRLPPPLGERARRLAERAIVPILWPGERTRRLRAALDVLERRVARMIDERRTGGTRRRDLLSLLLEARDDEGAPMSDRQVRDEILTLFVAGHETTANALAWSLMLLAQHPDIEARVRDEALALEGPPTAADAARLPLALQVFKESMRIYPPVFMFGRVATSDTQLGDHQVPKGTVVLLAPYALHRRPDVWPEPDRFDPARFAPEAEAARHRSAFLPFSAGPRTCIGLHFALLEGPLVLASLLRRARFELVDPRGAEAEPVATLRPRGGLPMRVHLRAASS